MQFTLYEFKLVFSKFIYQLRIWCGLMVQQYALTQWFKITKLAEKQNIKLEHILTGINKCYSLFFTIKLERILTGINTCYSLFFTITFY